MRPARSEIPTLFQNSTKVVDLLDTALSERLALMVQGADPENVELDPGTLKALQSLGYIR